MIFAKREEPQVSKMTCPITGRSYVTRPEWILSSSHHTYRLGVLDGEIILCQSFGRTCVDDVLQYCKVIEAILLEFRKPGRKMVVLEDYTHLGATDNATRQTYINFHMGHQQDLHGIFYFGLNSFLKLIVRFSRRILPLRILVGACDNYEDALRQAFQLLGRPFHRKTAATVEGATHWSQAGLVAEFQPLDEHRALRVSLSGTFTKTSGPAFFAVYEQALVRHAPPARGYYQVFDFSELGSCDLGAALVCSREFVRLDKLFPPRRHLLCGVSRTLKALLFVLNPVHFRSMVFLPAGADSKAWIQDFLQQTNAFPSQVHRDGFWKRLKSILLRDDGEMAQRLMEFIGEIQWDSTAKGTNPYPVDHPFHQVAAALQVVKSDFDQLIAERLRREKELEEARERAEESNRLQARFLANVSHEIRTPLNAILGMGEILVDTELDPQQHDLLRTMRQSGQSLLTVINDILDLSRMEAGEFRLSNESFDVSQLLEDVGRMLGYLAVNKGLDWKVKVVGDIPGSLKGDPVRLRQILVNLGGNAVKFTEKGSVSMEVRRVGTSPNGPIVQIRVQDTGPGIPPDRIGEIFQPFRQLDGSLSRRHGGTGLGLAIAHNLVRQMGGNLGVESTPQGSIFSFRLSLAEGESLGPRSESISRVAVPLAGRILVAEDNRINQKVVIGLLGKLGIEADVAENGRLVLERLAAHPGEYQMVLMDIQMPEMDGLEAVRRIRAGEAGEAGRTIPVVALTAHAMEGDRELFLQKGMDGYLSKPIHLKDLRVSLETWLSAERT
jgi:signal transduction histidine kinase